MRIQTNSREISLVFSQPDGSYFIQNLDELARGISFSVDAENVDSSGLLTLRFFRSESDNWYHKTKKEVVFHLSEDAISHAKHKLDEFMHYGFFSTPEFYEFTDRENPLPRKSKILRTYFIPESVFSMAIRPHEAK